MLFLYTSIHTLHRKSQIPDLKVHRVKDYCIQPSIVYYLLSAQDHVAEYISHEVYWAGISIPSSAARSESIYRTGGLFLSP